MKIFILNLKNPIDMFLWDDILKTVLSDEGSLSRGDPLGGQSESWPDRGAPGWSTGWWPRWSAGRRRALRHWARAVALPREAGTLILPPRVPAGALAPPAAPSPRAGRARDWQTSDALRRENAETRACHSGATLSGPRKARPDGDEPGISM